MRPIRVIALSATLAAAARATPTSLVPLGPGFDPSTYAGQLRSTVFASGLSAPTSMQSYGGGVLVATSDSNPFYSPSASSRLLLLTDTDHDGVADARVDLTPAAGLPGGVSSVRQAGDLLFVTGNVTGSPIISVLHAGETPTSPFTSLGTINLGFSASWEHTSYALATRPTPGQAGKYDVLFNVGSRTNDTSDAGHFDTYFATATASGPHVAGLNATHLDGESIYMTTVSFDGTDAAFAAPVKVAAGLRNASGIAFQPASGDLYFNDNGIDGSAANGHPADRYGNAAYSEDTLHRIAAGAIGTAVNPSNFATDFYENGSGSSLVHGNPDAIAHFASFGPYAADGSSPNESEGADEIAFAPAGFPSPLSNGIFVGFHGQFDKVGAPDPATGAGNEENPVVFYDASTGQYWHFIGTDEPNVGHLDGLLSTSDTLYLSDISDGPLFSGATDTGAIYAITIVPEPGVASLLAVAAVAVRSRRRKP